MSRSAEIEIGRGAFTAYMLRRTVFYSGRVQGVGFRYTTCRIAEQFDVTGFVRNLADGRVETVVEGESAEVDRFLSEVSRETAGHIREAKMHESPATGEFDQFSVRNDSGA